MPPFSVCNLWHVFIPQAPLLSTNFLYEIDRITQDIVSVSMPHFDAVYVKCYMLSVSMTCLYAVTK